MEVRILSGVPRRDVAQVGQRAGSGDRRPPVRIRPSRPAHGGASRQMATAAVSKTVGAKARGSSTLPSSAPAPLAQLVEQPALNRRVAGSSPARRTTRQTGPSDRLLSRATVRLLPETISR